MEKVRELSPDAINRWGNPLYRIYLNLNMGSKFEEMDHLLEKHQIEERRSYNSQNFGNRFGIADGDNMDKHLGNP